METNIDRRLFQLRKLVIIIVRTSSLIFPSSRRAFRLQLYHQQRNDERCTSTIIKVKINKETIMSSPIVAVSTTTAHSPSVDATETEDTTMMEGGSDDVITSPTPKESSSPAAPNTPTTPVTTETSTDPAAIAAAAAASDTGTANNNTSSTTATVAPPSAVEFEPPVACVRRILKKTLPSSSNVGKDAVAAFARASGIFIIYLTACANDFARENRRQTITANDVLAAIKVSVVVVVLCICSVASSGNKQKKSVFSIIWYFVLHASPFGQ
jgi:histone H3/H4